MRLKELIEELQDKLQELGDVEVMSSSNYGDYDSIEAEAVKSLGRNEVIKLKRKLGIDLSEYDIEYLISKLG